LWKPCSWDSSDQRFVLEKAPPLGRILHPSELLGKCQ
jgi:hypothetical protein